MWADQVAMGRQIYTLILDEQYKYMCTDTRLEHVFFVIASRELPVLLRQ